MKPINGNVILRQVEGSNIHSSGLILKQAEKKWEVVAATEGSELKAGDIVLCQERGSGQKVDHKGREFWVMPEDEVLAIVKEEK